MPNFFLVAALLRARFDQQRIHAKCTRDKARMADGGLASFLQR